MLFTSLAFIVFLSVTLTVYYLLKERQWQFLLLMNFVFYAFSGWQNLFFIAATILSAYYAGRRMNALSRKQDQKISILRDKLSKAELKAIKTQTNAKRRKWLIACLIFNFGILAVMKYTGFLFANLNQFASFFGLGSPLPLFNILIPMGISFYTFQTMGYIIDVYQNKIAAEDNLGKLALFTSFFPQLVQGPISRFGDLKETLSATRRFSADNFRAGFIRVLYGFVKKLIIADRLMIAIKILVEERESYQGVYVLAVMLFYAVTLYADFTGGMDIAIGAARMLGIRLTENFNRPFYSVSIADYWRRWHITMGTWFKDYLFYPISVSRWMLRFLKFTRRIFGDKLGKKIPVYLATLIVWFATGLWHGAQWHFIVWGLLNGAVIVVSEQLSPLYARFHSRFPWGGAAWYKAFAILRTFWLMCLLRTFDVYAGVSSTFKMYASVFTRFSLDQFVSDGFSKLGLSAADYAAAAAGTALMIVIGVLRHSAKMEFADFPPAAQWAAYILCIFAVVIFGVYGFGYDSNQFIYNRF